MDPASLPRFPSRDLLGGEVESIDESAGLAVVSFAPPADMLNPAGTLQGGYIAAMLDDAAGLATWLVAGSRRFTTAQMSVNYLRPVTLDDRLEVVARVSHSGSRQALIECELRQRGDDEVRVRATLVNLFIGS